MNLRLALAGLHVPGAMRRRGLAELVQRTARAFEVPGPPIADLSAEEALRRFAAFTRERADAVAGAPEEAARLRARLRAEARELGSALRLRLRVTTRAEAMRAARVLYRMLGIDLRASLSGGITVRSCAFSSAYTCDACRLMSAMDEGLFAGLAGEGRLEFSRRLTDGSGSCVAFFTFEPERP